MTVFTESLFYDSIVKTMNSYMKYEKNSFFFLFGFRYQYFSKRIPFLKSHSDSSCIALSELRYRPGMEQCSLFSIFL